MAAMRFVFYCVLVLSVLSTVIGDTTSASKQEEEDLIAYEKELDRLFQELVEERSAGNVIYYDSESYAPRSFTFDSHKRFGSHVPRPPIDLTSDDLGDRREGSGNSNDFPPDNENNFGSSEPPNYPEQKTGSGSGRQSMTKELPFDFDFNNGPHEKQVVVPLGSSRGSGFVPICLIDIGPTRATYRKCLHDKLYPPGQQQTVENTTNNRDFSRFLRSCSKTDELRECFEEFHASKLTLCPHEDESYFVRSLRGIADHIIKIICHTEGDRILVLITDGAIICLKKNGFKMLICLNPHLNLMQEAIFGVPSPKSLEEKCNDLREAEKCFNQELESCEESLSSLPKIGVVGLVFDLARELAACENPGPVIDPSSDSSTNSEEVPKVRTTLNPLRLSDFIMRYTSPKPDTTSLETPAGRTSPQLSTERNKIRAGHVFPQVLDFVTRLNELNDMDEHSLVDQEDSYNTGVPEDNTSHVDENTTNGEAVQNEDEDHIKNTSETTGNDLPIKGNLMLANRILTTSRNESEDTDNETNTAYSYYAAIGITLGLTLAILGCFLLSMVQFETTVLV